MQNPSRPQPLTFSHAPRAAAEETWSSDSDSGITADSHSPPSKTTPDSGIGSEQPSWNLPPGAPQPSASLLSDTTAPGNGCSMSQGSRASTTTSTTRAGLPVTSPEESAEERQRQQDYVRNTLLEYERQKMLEEQRGRKFYGRDHHHNAADPDRRSSSLSSSSSSIYANTGSISSCRETSGGDAENVVVANDYVPCQMAGRKLRHPEDEGEEGQGDVSDGPPRVTYHDVSRDHAHRAVTYQDLSERFSAGDIFSQGDEGYGTDSRSNTTGSLASPLSLSLSSLTTDSSGSLNGSQRGGSAPGGGCGSARAQPVASSGRLVIGKRGMLVKRRDLPPVERADTVTLEDRLRALTTIQEEDSATAASSSSSPSFPSSGGVVVSQTASPGNQRKEATQQHVTDRPDPGVQDSGSRSRSGDGQTYPEGLYSVITKRPNQLYVTSSSRPVPSRSRTEGGGEIASSNVHRAVPMRVHPQGEDLSSFQRTGHTDLPGHAPSTTTTTTSKRTAAADSCSTKSSSSDGKNEVRFKAGGGGVKLNDSGQFEIDYSYYMKASPSESNDEINTYSPTFPRTQFGEAFREGESVPPRRRSTPRSPKSSDLQTEDEGRYPRWTDANLYSNMDFVEEAGSSYLTENVTPPHAHDFSYPGETEHVYMNVGRVESRLKQGSMPNLSTPQHHHHRRHHSGDGSAVATTTKHQEPQRHAQETGPPQSILKRNPTPGSGYLSAAGGSGRRSGHGDRNSCDVGSLYRQSDLSHTFPPPSQGVASDRLSLNLGDLPRIHEQLRATSEMLLSSGKRHQFASSSDIYRLFQGQQGQGHGGGGGFAQGRQPPHRRSFHEFSSSQSHSLSEVRSRISGSRSGLDQSQTATSSPKVSPRPPAQGPIRGNHNISVPDSTAELYRGGPEHVVSSRASSRHVTYTRDAAGAAPSGRGRDGPGVTLKERLDRGQQFSTDVIQSEEGEQLSTLV
ncbi:uncharacterized protein LOC143302049 [Babylonia areolata]|uniref:uncharacterized protein LOC143302049 n=1 Tax=Babylonia areolata TaxID=304850 RepID=UPI003FD4CDB2